jgi:hypothetical protein
MRLYLVLALNVLALAACGSSENPGKSALGGNGSAEPLPSSGGAAGGKTVGGGTGGAIGGAVDGGTTTDGSTNMDAGLSNQPCSWLATCISSDNCSSEACIEACAVQASSAAIDQYSALLDCVTANQPQCPTTSCLTEVCAEQINACTGTTSAPQDAGTPIFLDAATGSQDTKQGTADAPPKADAGAIPTVDAADVVAVPPKTDAGPDVTTSGQGYTTSGSCDVVVKIPNLVDSHTCWDYTLTVTANHNDGTEHYVAYTSTDVSGTQSACTSQAYSGSQPGPWDSASISASNLSHKKQACDLAGASYGATSTWTEGGACGLAGSLGHCTDAVVNVWDPSSQALSSSLTGAWSVP